MHDQASILAVFSSVLFLVACMLTFIIALLLQYSKRQQEEQLILRQTEGRFEKELLQAQLEVQEQTLEDIAREVHDNIGSLVSMAIAHTHSLKRPEEQIENIRPLLKQIHADVRGLSRALSIETILANGLTTAIEQLVEYVRKIGLHEVVFTVLGNYHFQEVKLEIFAFRILQESVNNARKHAKATKISITMSNSPSTMCFEIEDNGRGIDLTASPKAGGLTNIKRRAALINAKLKIENPPYGGTKISLCIPLPENNGIDPDES